MPEHIGAMLKEAGYSKSTVDAVMNRLSKIGQKKGKKNNAIDDEPEKKLIQKSQLVPNKFSSIARVTLRQFTNMLSMS